MKEEIYMPLFAIAVVIWLAVISFRLEELKPDAELLRLKKELATQSIETEKLEAVLAKKWALKLQCTEGSDGFPGSCPTELYQ